LVDAPPASPARRWAIIDQSIPKYDTSTRSELLARRGYDGTEEPYGLADGQAVDEEPRRCKGCGRDLSDRSAQTIWCSQPCRSKWRSANEGADRQDDRSPLPVTPGALKVNVEAAGWPLPEIVSTLLDAGATFEIFPTERKVTAWR
jgi:hypothetical protein